jgi:hypothetical protein
MFELQNILVYIILVAALLFLVKKFFLKNKKRNKAECEEGCGCH